MLPNYPWTCQVSYVLPPPALVQPGSIQIPGRMCHRSVQTSYSSGTLPDGAPCLLTILNMLADIPQWPHNEKPHHGCLSWLNAQGSMNAAFNHLAPHRCVLHRQRFSSSVCHAVAGGLQASMLKVYQQCWKEWTR